MISQFIQTIKSSTSSIHYFSLLLFCFCLPLWSRGAVIAIVLIVLNSIFTRRIFRNFRQVVAPQPLLLISLFIVYLIGLAYTEDVGEGLRDIESKLAFLFLPLVFYTAPAIEEKQLEQMMTLFSLACLIAISKGIYLAVYYHPAVPNNYMFFGKYTGVHSSYFCIYVGLCIFYIGRKLIVKKVDHLFSIRKNLYSISLLCLAGSVFFLGARMGFILLVLLLSLFYIVYMYHENQLFKGSLFLVVILFLTAILSWSIPQSQSQIKSVVGSEKVEDPRIIIWSSALNVISKKVLFGHGTGDVHNEMMKVFEQRKYELGLKASFNPHNQYLQTTVALGMVGLFILMSNFLIAIWAAYKSKHYLYLFFILMFAASCLTESMLEVERGILFFTFFNCCFAKMSTDPELCL